MKTTHSRAAKGGQLGANGEWYEGGKFIATTDHPKGGPKKHKKTGRVEIEPYVWVDGQEGKSPIFRTMAGVEIFNRDNNTFSFNPDLRLHYAEPEAIENRKANIAAYNSGLRWKVLSTGIFE